ncbi:MAG: beta-CASP ribonuclease aCPSF1 [Candidatus Hadarchaeia archaeon]
MSAEDVINEVKEAIRVETNLAGSVTDVEFEGPKVAVYCDDLDALMDDGRLVKKLAKKVQKRITLRPDSSIRLPPEEAKNRIMELVPDEANITDITFEPSLGEVVIETEKPGLAIGKGGKLLRKILKEIRWTPKIIRDPPIESEIINDIRRAMIGEAEERKEILRDIGRSIYREKTSDGEWVRITALGGSREVGRSANLLQTPESKVLLDCGLNVAQEGRDAFPYIDAPEIRLHEIDAVIVTHAHLDHSGFVPYLFRYGYEGPVYCTPPTRDLSVLLQLDYVDIARNEGKEIPYSKKDVKESVKRTIPLDYGDVTDIAPDVRLTLHNSGHILGASVAHLHIGEGLYNVVYTGDLKFENSRLLSAAENNFPRMETLIIDSTYGGSDSMQPSREESEKKFLKAVSRTIERGGKVIVPSFAVGRAQEIMLLLDDYSRKNGLENVPVYLDGMIWEATSIHTAYPEYLSSNLKKEILHKDRNPFLSDIFERVKSSEKRETIISGGPSIILATAGMMAGGPVLEYFKRLAPDPRNMLIFVGYQGEGTLGRRIQKGWREIPMGTENGRRDVVEVNLDVETVEGFSAHSDRSQLVNFVRNSSPKPKRVLCVHGESKRCVDLCSSLHKMFKIRTDAPKNLETTRLY